MKEEKRDPNFVYLSGDEKHKESVIKALESFGAKNIKGLKGDNPHMNYYIEPSQSILTSTKYQISAVSKGSEFDLNVLFNRGHIIKPLVEGTILKNIYKTAFIVFSHFTFVDDDYEMKAKYYIDNNTFEYNFMEHNYSMYDYVIASEKDMNVFKSILKHQKKVWDPEKNTISDDKFWVPEKLQNYYYIDNFGQVNCTRNYNDDDDKLRFKIFNCFISRYDAQKIAYFIHSVLSDEKREEIIKDYWERKESQK